MPVRFLDEEPTTQAPKPRVRFLDEEPETAKVRFTNGPRPTPPDTLDARLSNPTYIPSKDEWRSMKESGKAKTLSFKEATGIVKNAFTEAAGAVTSGAAETGKSLVQGKLKEVGQSLAESLARGTLDLGILGRQIAQNVTTATNERVIRRRNEFARFRQRAGLPNDAEKVKKLNAATEDREYQQFVTLRKAQAIRHLATIGDENLLDRFLGEGNQINQKIAEGGSYFLDPSAFFSAGVGPATRVSGKLARGIGRGTRLAGSATRGAAEAVKQNIDPITAGAATAAVGPSTALQVRAGLEVPGAVEKAGAGIEAVGRAISQSPSQVGILEAVAKDEAASTVAQATARRLSNSTTNALAERAVDAVEGVISGSVAGAALGGLAGGAEGALAGVGSGLAMGPISSLASAEGARLTGKKRVKAEDADIARFQESLQGFAVNDIAGFEKLPRSTQLQMATVQAAMPDTRIEFVTGETFRSGLGSQESSAQAYYDPGSRTIRVNSGSPNIAADFMHEVGHAIFDSPAVDKSQIAVELDRLYGADGLQELGRRLIERRTRDERSGKPLPPDTVNALLTEQLLADPEFIIKEVFAESFMDLTMDEAFNSLRKGRATSFEQGPLRRAWVEAKAQVLSRLGIVPEDSGYTPIRANQFGQDVRLKHDKRFAKMVRKYLKDVDTYYGQENAQVKKGHKGAKVSLQDLKDAPYAGWVAREDGTFENDFAVLKDGKVAAKPGKETQATIARRREDVSSLLAQELTGSRELRVKDLEGLLDQTRAIEPDPNVKAMSPRLDSRGRRIITGTILPEKFFDLDSYSPDQKANAKVLQDAMGTDDTYSGWYQAIGTSSSGEGSWAKSVRRNLGNLRVQQREFKPLTFRLSSEGNLMVTSLDVGRIAEKAARWKKIGKLDAWQGNRRAFDQDMLTYLRNHAEGQPGAKGIGEHKRNLLNAFFGVGGADANPLATSYNAGEGNLRSLIRDFRLDRLNSVNRTGRQGFHFDYEKQKLNFKQGLNFRSKEDVRKEVAQINRENSDAIPLKINKIKNVTDEDGNTELKAEIKAQGYLLVKGTGVHGAKSKGYERQVKRIGKKLAAEVKEALANPEIRAGIGWYQHMRGWLQKTFGANMEKFAHVLGATSAQTDVRSNFIATMDAMKSLAQGRYDDLLSRFHEHVLATKKKVEDGEIPRKEYIKNVNKWDELPTKSNGKKFNTNGLATLKALYGIWLEAAGGPKTPNFAGNLTGRTLDATIDVWAARGLRRLIYDNGRRRWRIQPKAEVGVSEADFNFGQAVYAEAAKEVGMAPDDLQALMWFAEKDLWDRNGWTRNEGAKKSSFEDEAQHIQGDRFQLGVTTAREDFFNPDALSEARAELRRAVGKLPGIMASRVNVSDGYYQQYGEPTLDVEFTIQAGSDFQLVVDVMRDIGRRYEQDDVFVSQIVDANHPNARPGFEIGFRHAQPEEVLAELVPELTGVFEGVGGVGYTIAKDDQGGILSVRAQFVPEFAGALTVEDAVKASTAWHKKARELLDKKNQDDKVSYATESFFNTQVFQGADEAVGPLRSSELGSELERRQTANERGGSLRTVERRRIQADGQGSGATPGMGNKQIARVREFPRGGRLVIFTDGSRATRVSPRENWRVFDADGKLTGTVKDLPGTITSGSR